MFRYLPSERYLILIRIRNLGRDLNCFPPGQPILINIVRISNYYPTFPRFFFLKISIKQFILRWKLVQNLMNSNHPEGPNDKNEII